MAVKVELAPARGKLDVTEVTPLPNGCLSAAREDPVAGILDAAFAGQEEARHQPGAIKVEINVPGI